MLIVICHKINDFISTNIQIMAFLTSTALQHNYFLCQIPKSQ